MIIDEISLYNFGVYMGYQSIQLTPVSPKKPIVLLGGFNGVGKTTLLDALQLVFFGKMATCSNRGKLSYDEFLRRSIHQKADPSSGSEIGIKFRHNLNGKEYKYFLKRTWKVNGAGVREHIEVEKDGLFDSVMTESWDEHVEQFIPLQISNLFLFDGEKIKDLANLEKSSELLSTGIHSLLGMELVDRLSSDLLVLERRKKTSLKPKDERKQIGIEKAKIDKLTTRRREVYQEIGAAQNKLDFIQRKLNDLEERFRLEGGELYENREALETERIDRESHLKELENELRELAAEEAPLLFVKPLLSAIEQQADKEEACQQSKALSKILADRDAEVLCILKSHEIKKNLIKVINQSLKKDRKQRSAMEKTPLYLNLNDEDRELLSNLSNVILPRVRNQIPRMIESVEKLKSEIMEIDRKISIIPDKEALNALIEEIKEIRVAENKAKTLLLAKKGEYEYLQKEIEFRKAKLIKNIESAVDEEFEQEDSLRIIDHTQRVRKTLEKFRIAVVNRHVNRIQELVLDCFRQLFRKKSLLTDIRIDPETFSLELFGKGGRKLSPDRLSAGECQLLAVALLWGLARASGRPLPAVIDTPLGRLDASHRLRLVERYFPFASHQVLLLSTDEEITEKYYNKLKRWVGRSYHLDFDESTDATTIRPGYFW